MLAAAAITRAPLLLGGSALPRLGSAALLNGGARLSNCADRMVRTTPLSRSHAPRFRRGAHEQRADRSLPAAGALRPSRRWAAIAHHRAA